MAKITFEKLSKETDNNFYENTKQEAYSKIAPLCCPNDENAFVHIAIGKGDGRWSIKIIHSCCPDFRELVRRTVYPLAE